jgi:hypothetical protein
MNLECSSKGDTDYSALFAKVDGVSIEHRYQLSKRFLFNQCIVHPETYKQAKYWQRRNEYFLLDFVVDSHIYSLEYLSMFYNSLWYKYLIKNSKLIKNLEKYDTFTDCFKNSNTINSQCDIIALVANKGIDELKRQSGIFI